MTSLPAELWGLILDQVAEPESVENPFDEYPKIAAAMASLITCYTLDSSLEFRAHSELTKLVTERWARAEAALLKLAEKDISFRVACYRAWHRERWYTIPMRWSEYVVRTTYDGMTVRFYWCLGMARPEVIGCQYNVEDIRADVLAKWRAEGVRHDLNDTDIPDHIREPYLFDAAKHPDRLTAHHSFPLGVESAVTCCAYPRCPLCKRSHPQKIGATTVSN